VRTFLEFQNHIELHRIRVAKLGRALAKHKFPAINQGLLGEFLELHDHSKVLISRGDLHQFDYTHRDLPVQRLYSFYGRSPKTESESRKLTDIINDINDIDKKVCANFFAKHSQLSWGAQEDFYTIEKVADLVDRSLDPMAAEEFGQRMILASDFIDDPYMVKLSLWLESHYHQITKNLRFSSVS